MRRIVLRLSLLVLPACLARAQSSALSVNLSSREESRMFYRTIFNASENMPLVWTGDYASGNAGNTSAAFKEAVRLRINFYRALVGVPADIAFSANYSSRAQQAAMLMSVNNALNHTPPPSWILYNAVAADAASNSNLALGQFGPDAINGYIADPGDNNAAVGHRRWLIYPQTLQMGTGDVPGIAMNSVVPSANAVWVFDTTPGGQFGAPRPATRTTAVPYPPAGFVPHQLVWPRWSFSYPGADFSTATISMTRNGQGVVVDREPILNNMGEPTLVWVYDNQNRALATSHAKPAVDTTYTVNINAVRIGTATQNFSYTVTVFDPDVASPDAVPFTIGGTPTPVVGGVNSYTVTKPSFAPGLDWRVVQLTPVTQTFTAETGLEGLIAATSTGYDVVQSISGATGARAYRLAHLQPITDQALRLPDTYLVSGPNSALAFRSRLGIATGTEVAHVQVSIDDGMSWSDVFAQTGTSATDTNTPLSTETAFVPRTISLAAYVGRTIVIRFVYTSGFGITFVPTADNPVGWFIDDLMLTNVQQVAAQPPARVANGTSFTFTPTSAGAVGLQARGLMFGYPMEWGPISQVSAMAGDVPATTSYLSNLSVRTTAGTGSQTLIVGFAVTGGTKPLLIRGIGPELAKFGVGGVLNDPKLELFRNTEKIGENDNWLASDAPTFGRVGAFGLTNGSRDSALSLNLAPGSYTAQVTEGVGGSGAALVELYDASNGASDARLSNVSARSQISPENPTLFAGFTVGGTGSRMLLVRAIGPTLGVFGVSDALANPRLELFGSNGKIQENDDWDTATRGTFSRVGAFDLATGSRDAVLLVNLPPGSYTAQVTGAGGSSGVVLVEVYDVR